jgi:hypothetical protein
MHNFPSDINISVKNVTLIQAKTILKLCIDEDIDIYEGVVKIKVDSNYPNYHYDSDDNFMNYNRADNGHKRYYFVSFSEFCNYIKGKGTKYKQPFKEEIALNDSYTAIITKKEITVGCQSFSHEIIEKLYNTSKKALNYA